MAARMRVVRAWLAWCGPRWPEATWRDVERYGDTRDVAATTWRDELSHLAAFYRWAIRNDLCTQDPTVLVERPRTGRRLPRPITPAQYARLLDGADPQMVAMLELMAFCGLRCCEVAWLRWTDLDLIERSGIIRGKGNRERVIGLPVRVVRALAAVDHPGVYVIERASGGPFTPCRISQLVGRWARSQGVAISAHRLRHTYATAQLRRSGRIEIVQALLGHVSVSSTEIYAQVENARVLEVARTIEDLV